MSRVTTAVRIQKTNGHPLVRWRFRTERDVRKFWKEFRRVPALARRNGRDERRYCLALYLFALATHSRLRYPLLVEESLSGDFRMRASNVETMLSIAKANQIWEAQNEHSNADWLAQVQRAIEEEARSVKPLNPTARRDLLVYQDVPIPAAERATGLQTLRSWLRLLKKENPGWDRVSIIFSLDVELDTGRKFRNLEFIDWSNPDAFADFGERVEFEGQKATVTAIRWHLREGRPTYSLDRRGRLLKRMPNGHQHEVSRDPRSEAAEAIESG